MSEVITSTLGSGFTLVIHRTVDTGEILLALLLLSLLAMMVLDFTFRTVYRR